jgi:hypothetical protein
MKKFLALSLLSFSAFASECFVREVELVTKDVSLAKEICFDEPVVRLDVFGKSTATLNYTLDGVAVQKEVKLERPIERGDGRVAFYAYEIQFNSLGGWCSDMVTANVDLFFSLERDGSNLSLDEVEGIVSSTQDNCHRSMEIIQNISYKRK